RGAGTFPAFEAGRASFGQAILIDDPRAPTLLDALARRWDTAARFAGHDDRPHGALGQGPGSRSPGSHFRQAKGIGGRATEAVRFSRVDQRKALVARHRTR